MPSALAASAVDSIRFMSLIVIMIAGFVNAYLWFVMLYCFATTRYLLDGEIQQLLRLVFRESAAGA